MAIIGICGNYKSSGPLRKRRVVDNLNDKKQLRPVLLQKFAQ